MRRLLPLLFALSLVAPACGGSLAPEIERARLVLDGPPSAVHAGVVLTLARDFDRGEGVNLRLRRTAESRPPAELLRTGRADLAVLSIDDLAAARADGTDVVGVMALVQAPLVGVLHDGVARPRALEGERVASVSGTERGVARALVEDDGGDPGALRFVAAEEPARAVRDGRAAGAVGRWDLEPSLDVFRPEEFGAPLFPGLVLATLRTTLQDKPSLVRGTIRAIDRGYDEAIRDPELAIQTLIRRTAARDRVALIEQFRAVSPAFTAGGRAFGALDREALTAWASWAKRAGLIDESVEADSAFVSTAG